MAILGNEEATDGGGGGDVENKLGSVWDFVGVIRRDVVEGGGGVE